jgi:hypothetical protein
MTVMDFTLPSSSIDVSTPEGLLQVLKRGLFKPAYSQFKELREDDEHLRLLLPRRVRRGEWHRLRRRTTGPSRSRAATALTRPSCPMTTGCSPRSSPTTTLGARPTARCSSSLSRANDQDVSDSYDLPIQVLEAFIAGCRTFRWTSSHNVVPQFEGE